VRNEKKKGERLLTELNKAIHSIINKGRNEKEPLLGLGKGKFSHRKQHLEMCDVYGMGKEPTAKTKGGKKIQEMGTRRFSMWGGGASS